MPKFFYKGKRSGGQDPNITGDSNFFAAFWRRLGKGKKIALVFAGSVLLLVLALGIFMKLYIRPPEDRSIVVNNPSPSPVELTPGASPGPSGTPDPNKPANTPDSGYTKREGVYTFLLLGTNEGLTDTIMVATLDTKSGTCSVLSIPRDTSINSAPRSAKKINSAYSQRNNVDEPGIAQVKKEIATLIGFQPQYTAVVDYNGFKRLITAIGGIEFDVPRRMYKPSEGIDLQKGLQPLNADQALQVVRYRVNEDPKTGGYDDYGRMETQQKLLAAAAKKALSNWTKFLEYIDIAQENLKSDIDWGNIAWLAEQVSNIGMDNVSFATLPTYTVSVPKELTDAANHSSEVVKAGEALKLINETINPFTTDITADIVEYAVLTEK